MSGEEPAGASQQLVPVAARHSQPTRGMAASRTAWEQPGHCRVPITWLFCNRVAFGSLNFYLSIPLPAEVLESTALAPCTSAEPPETELSAGSTDNPFCCWKLPPSQSWVLPCLRDNARCVPPALPLAAGQVRLTGVGGTCTCDVVPPARMFCVRKVRCTTCYSWLL